MARQARKQQPSPEIPGPASAGPAVSTAKQPARERLLNAAAVALIDNDGGFEMSHVAEIAKSSAGLAYHYFGSKSGLISAVVAAFYDRYDAVANERMDPDESWGVREKRRLKNLVGFLFTDPLAPIVLGRLGRTPEVAAVEAARRQTMSELAARNIANGQHHGAIAAEIDPLVTGAAIIGGIQQACALALTRRDQGAQAVLIESLWAFIAGAVRLKED